MPDQSPQGEFTAGQTAYVVIDTWAGRTCHAVDVLKVGPKRCRIRFRVSACASKPAGHEQYLGKKFLLLAKPKWADGERLAGEWPENPTPYQLAVAAQ